MDVLNLLLLLLPALLTHVSGRRPPHIIFILADDLGWNDVSFHGSDQIPTPNIDALAYSGIVLNNYYVAPICSPSRSALMTGKHPIHTGMQHDVIYGTQPYGLPLSLTLLPERLQSLGYATRMVGKWHLGSFREQYTPTRRGFQSHFGYWTGHKDYYDHTAQEGENWGYDLRRNMSVAWDAVGRYTTDLFTEEAVDVIRRHDAAEDGPLFLYLSHLAVHSANPYSLLQAPPQAVQRFPYVAHAQRRIFAGMVSELDRSVGRVVQALQDRGMLSDSLVVFSTDNGGPAAGFDGNAASNWPLRGVKNTLWEGGVRGAALLWSPLLKLGRRVSHQLMTIEDWLPTLFSAAGGNGSSLLGLDGLDMWQSLSDNTKSPRTQLLHNIDDIYGNAAVRVGDWKLLRGTTYGGVWDSWYGPSGRRKPNSTSPIPPYNASAVQSSPVGMVLKQLGLPLDKKEILRLRAEATVSCPAAPKQALPCHLLKETCLFNVVLDPCEQNNVATLHPEKVQEMKKALQAYNSTAVPPANKKGDPRGNPKFWGYTWNNWMDYM